ncbi:hypothetical protein CFBP4996_01615 [Agrobacterium leguminum]|uniref:hypothetical protein n=1 Tax=Agrobacterium leguminum TaxID=2792015 RepID=UPI001E49E66F|nr:hypothetical protein [Agrobacterium leguminum]WFS66017.1 hypothetical protein CFBP4996_01615 [Agrobacterium leguminum]
MRAKSVSSIAEVSGEIPPRISMGANYQRSIALVKYSIQFHASSVPCLRQHGICHFELAFVKAAAAGQGDDGGFFRQVDQNNDSGFDCGVFIVIDVLKFFRFSSNRENTLTLYFSAFPDGKPGSTFPGNALMKPAQQAGTILQWPRVDLLSQARRKDRWRSGRFMRGRRCFSHPRASSSSSPS